MHILDFNFWQGNVRVLGIIAIVVGAGAWVMDFAGAVYICPYCRLQRSVILLLGVVMLGGPLRHWMAKYIVLVIGFMGAVVAVNQNFMGWSRLSKGEFSWGEQWYLNPFLLSGAALFIITAQVGLLIVASQGKDDADSA